MMKFIEKPLIPRSYTSVLMLAGSVFLMLTPTVFAQDENPDEEADDVLLEEVIVTGSRIKRRDFSSPSPIATIDREDFEFSGQPTLEEYLNQMPQVQPDFGRTANNPGDGTARLNLRGLGAGRTLVLLNGRRVAPSGISSAVNINNLPRALMERVEIITGGASTVYGSDAIAGVVNFITRQNFDGLGVDGSYSVSAEGDAAIYDASITYGHQLANERGNITVFASYYNRDPLFASERELTSMVWSDTWQGELIPWGNGFIPGSVANAPRVDLGTGRDRATWDPDGIPYAWDSINERYNYAPINYLQTPLTRNTLGLMGTFNLAGGYQAYLEAVYTRSESKLTLASSPFFEPITVNTDNPVLTPETRQLFEEQMLIGPGLAGMFLGRRMLELGQRIIEYDRKYTRVVAGVRGEFTDNWEVDAWFTYTDSSEQELLSNDGSVSRVLQGLLVDPATGQCFDPSGGCVPLDIFGENRLSAEGVDFIRVDPLENTTSRTQALAAVVVTGAPFKIWTGPVDMAFGAEWRSDDGQFHADEALFTGDTIGYRGDASVNGSEDVYEFYTEAILPLIANTESGHMLELELGVRYSDYKNAGTVWTYKAGLQWQPIPALRFRTMVQHAVRAPNIAELFTEQYTEGGVYVTVFSPDPCSASQDPHRNGNAEKCVLQGLPANQVGVFEATPSYPVDYTGGGNPNLVPEGSDTLTVGVVITPSRETDLTLAIDYFDLQVTDTIGEIQADLICFDPLNTANVFCENMSRDSSGNVRYISQLTSNRGLLGVEGIDTQFAYASDLPGWMSLLDDYSQLSINSTWTHILSTRTQENVVTTIQECAGLFGWPCEAFEHGISFPENRLTTNFDYTSGALNIHLTWRWIDGMDNAAQLGADILGWGDLDLAVPDVPSFNYFDLGFGYRFNDHFYARMGINNLTDEQAPLMADAVNRNNTDTRLYDIFGRTYFFSFGYTSR